MMAADEAGAAAGSVPGRRCPLHCRYRPEDFAVEAAAHLRALDVLYVVGGLYGNELALARVLELFDREPGRKRLVFNGDFHWFDVDPATFARVQRGVLAHEALRGNVETELAEPGWDGDAGCGCAHPGMPNFRGDEAGLLTRIAVEPSSGPQRRFGIALGRGVVAEAIAIEIDMPTWRARFEARWPEGSDAHVSYFDRIVRGPDYAVADAVRGLP